MVTLNGFQSIPNFLMSKLGIFWLQISSIQKFDAHISWQIKNLMAR
ncbi:hypothetical protein PROVRUST_05360 [Providencia rustigianii DSM 4541]|uniref:Uncharacterized protein n=1 Tax=Providencia rustigianii DSM 4541 TaxID=500637 RepID=D1NZK7_9GAMM|nr:hypothetical protein PROVRUST_05360 [Providencia rustigianii DSM 4541]